MESTLALRFAELIELLCAAIAEQIDGGSHLNRMAAPLLRHVQARLRRLSVTVAAAINAALAKIATPTAPDPAPRQTPAKPRPAPKPLTWRQRLHAWFQGPAQPTPNAPRPSYPAQPIAPTQAPPARPQPSLPASSPQRPRARAPCRPNPPKPRRSKPHPASEHAARIATPPPPALAFPRPPPTARQP